MITIVAIGKKHEDWVVSGINRYEKRLKPPFDARWIHLPHSSLQGDMARQEESERMHGRLPDSAYVVLLDERGTMYDSAGLSGLIEEAANRSRDIYIVIGGAYGVTDSLHARADVIVSLSKMVFPHQLVRLILTELLYRAQEISRGGSYHHE